MERYHLYDEIAAGRRAVVYKARVRSSLEYVALKRYNIALLAHVRHAVSFLHVLNHPNVLRFHEWYGTAKHVWVVVELASGGSLAGMLAADGPLPTEAVRLFGADILSALHHVHQHGLLLGDIRPSTFLSDENGTLKCADFTCAQRCAAADLPQRSRSLPTSIGYTAPELLCCNGLDAEAPAQRRALQRLLGSAAARSLGCLSRSSDLWAAGALLYHLALGRAPYGGNTAQDSLAAMLEAHSAEAPGDGGGSLPLLPAGCAPLSPALAHLLRRMLCLDPLRRPAWDEVLSHPFWRGSDLPPAHLPQGGDPRALAYRDSRPPVVAIPAPSAAGAAASDHREPGAPFGEEAGPGFPPQPAFAAYCAERRAEAASQRLDSMLGLPPAARASQEAPAAASFDAVAPGAARSSPGDSGIAHAGARDAGESLPLPGGPSRYHRGNPAAADEDADGSRSADRASPARTVDERRPPSAPSAAAVTAPHPAGGSDEPADDDEALPSAGEAAAVSLPAVASERESRDALQAAASPGISPAPAEVASSSARLSLEESLLMVTGDLVSSFCANPVGNGAAHASRGSAARSSMDYLLSAATPPQAALAPSGGPGPLAYAGHELVAADSTALQGTGASEAAFAGDDTTATAGTADSSLSSLFDFKHLPLSGIGAAAAAPEMPETVDRVPTATRATAAVMALDAAGGRGLTPAGSAAEAQTPAPTRDGAGALRRPPSPLLDLCSHVKEADAVLRSFAVLPGDMAVEPVATSHGWPAAAAGSLVLPGDQLPFAPCESIEALVGSRDALQRHIAAIYAGVVRSEHPVQLRVLAYIARLSAASDTASNWLLNSSLTAALCRLVTRSRSPTVQARAAQTLGLLVRHCTFVSPSILQQHRLLEVLAEVLTALLGASHSSPATGAAGAPSGSSTVDSSRVTLDTTAGSKTHCADRAPRRHSSAGPGARHTSDDAPGGAAVGFGSGAAPLSSRPPRDPTPHPVTARYVAAALAEVLFYVVTQAADAAALPEAEAGLEKGETLDEGAGVAHSEEKRAANDDFDGKEAEACAPSTDSKHADESSVPACAPFQLPPWVASFLSQHAVPDVSRPDDAATLVSVALLRGILNVFTVSPPAVAVLLGGDREALRSGEGGAVDAFSKRLLEAALSDVHHASRLRLMCLQLHCALSSLLAPAVADATSDRYREPADPAASLVTAQLLTAQARILDGLSTGRSPQPSLTHDEAAGLPKMIQLSAASAGAAPLLRPGSALSESAASGGAPLALRGSVAAHGRASGSGPRDASHAAEHAPSSAVTSRLLLAHGCTLSALLLHAAQAFDATIPVLPLSPTTAANSKLQQGLRMMLSVAARNVLASSQASQGMGDPGLARYSTMQCHVSTAAKLCALTACSIPFLMRSVLCPACGTGVSEAEQGMWDVGAAMADLLAGLPAAAAALLEQAPLVGLEEEALALLRIAHSSAMMASDALQLLAACAFGRSVVDAPAGCEGCSSGAHASALPAPFLSAAVVFCRPQSNPLLYGWPVDVPAQRLPSWHRRLISGARSKWLQSWVAWKDHGLSRVARLPRSAQLDSVPSLDFTLLAVAYAAALTDCDAGDSFAAERGAQLMKRAPAHLTPAHAVAAGVDGIADHEPGFRGQLTAAAVSAFVAAIRSQSGGPEMLERLPSLGVLQQLQLSHMCAAVVALLRSPHARGLLVAEQQPAWAEGADPYSLCEWSQRALLLVGERIPTADIGTAPARHRESLSQGLSGLLLQCVGVLETAWDLRALLGPGCERHLLTPAGGGCESPLTDSFHRASQAVGGFLQAEASDILVADDASRLAGGASHGGLLKAGGPQRSRASTPSARPPTPAHAAYDRVASAGLRLQPWVAATTRVLGHVVSSFDADSWADVVVGLGAPSLLQSCAAAAIACGVSDSAIIQSQSTTAASAPATGTAGGVEPSGSAALVQLADCFTVCGDLLCLVLSAVPSLTPILSDASAPAAAEALGHQSSAAEQHRRESKAAEADDMDRTLPHDTSAADGCDGDLFADLDISDLAVQPAPAACVEGASGAGRAFGPGGSETSKEAAAAAAIVAHILPLLPAALVAIHVCAARVARQHPSTSPRAVSSDAAQAILTSASDLCVLLCRLAPSHAALSLCTWQRSATELAARAVVWLLPAAAVAPHRSPAAALQLAFPTPMHLLAAALESSRGGSAALGSPAVSGHFAGGSVSSKRLSKVLQVVVAASADAASAARLAGCL